MMPTTVRCSQREQWSGEDRIRMTLSLRATAEEQMFLMKLHCGTLSEGSLPFSMSLYKPPKIQADGRGEEEEAFPTKKNWYLGVYLQFTISVPPAWAESER